MTRLERQEAFTAAPGPVDVEPLSANERREWSAFVASAPGATIFHDLAWGDAAEAVYGHRATRLVARRHGQIVGVLPMSEVRGPLFGHSLISTAFSVGGGVLALDEAARSALVQSAVAEGEVRGVGHVELRDRVDDPDWTTKEGVYVGHARPLASDDEAELLAAPRKRRAELRKGLNAESEGRMCARHDAGVDAFWRLYAVSVRNLGTPVFPRAFAAALVAGFGERAFCTVVEVDGTPAFSVLSFIHGKAVMPYYAGVTPLAREAKAADFGYFAIMREARARGLEVFDFGRSKVGSSHADYKKSWGFEAAPIAYSHRLIRAKNRTDVNPNNPKFRVLTNIWRRLPQPVANVLGPLVARELA